ncbi:ferrous iron transporter B [Eggerthia catenaformis OT 569 = DSM 20559]|uniref:Ferrous iron transport protein B n=1 Tax=Eggerthia catenaformis OT 569 = DSM 20559 TaxID=999415 RepID=M2PPV0_9FIRM|nr:ferrous iron transport protein B [Eggerthia catenaformis]EMD17594.1 ferrous iron transporter B [Eggerthia catenaformis OT 569 = DSM 20559]
MKIGLAGNPNSGKTTLFNDLTGSSQYVGNWPGVTVEKKDGKLKGNKDVIIQDLPGIYSLSPYTLEEVVSRRYLVNEKPDSVINIVDGTNIERNLYLTTQLLELGLPIVVAINMVDLIEKNGDHVDVAKLEKLLGVKAVTLSALKGKGTKETALEAIKIAHTKVSNRPEIFEGDTLKAIKQIEDLLRDSVDESMLRWFAVKVFERDQKAIEDGHITKTIIDQAEPIIKAVEDKEEDDAESIITSARYAFISHIIKETVVSKKAQGELSLSDKIDKIVTNRFLALPIFALIIWFMYYVSVSTLGTWMTDWTNDVLFGDIIPPAISGFLGSIGVAEWLINLIVDGIIGGVGTVLGFVPQILLIFVFLSVLEDCGYMARIAFIMDRLFRKFGLSGKSFIPILIGTGCGVPGIMAARTIENEKDRRMTIMLCTFIPCAAKTEIIAMISSVFFKGNSILAASMYFLSLAVIIFSGIALKKTKFFAGETAPFVMELPAYHLPQVKTVLMRVFERGKHFIIKAGTIIFAVAVITWFLKSFTPSFAYIDPESAEVSKSILRYIGEFISPIFQPLGFGNWQGGVSVLIALSAKELAASTVTVLAGKAGVASLFSVMGGFSYLLLNLFNPPCIAAMGTIWREMDSKFWAIFAISYQLILGYVIALIGYQLGSWLFFGASFGIGQIVALILSAVIVYFIVRPAYKEPVGNTVKA